MTMHRPPQTDGNATAARNDQGEDLFADELLTARDAARLLSVTVSWIYEHTRDDADDRLPCLRLGKYVRFDRADLRAYVDAKRRASQIGGRRR
jgi:excisionase family DNA binding protein